MIRRLERAIRGIKDHAAAARELSVGALEALTVLTRGPDTLSLTFARTDAEIRRSLPGF